MKRITIHFLVLILTLAGCKKIEIDNSEVIESMKISPLEIDADGTSLIDIFVTINKNAEAAKRKLVVESSSGVFPGNNLKNITIEAVYEGGELIARTKLRAPSGPGKVYISARPEIRNAFSDFILKDSITANPSVPASITVSASSFGVQTAYVGEVLITGHLRNGNGKNVSTGYKVQFSDFYVSGGAVGGRFRAIQNASDDNSRVSAYYSPGPVAPGTNIYVWVTVLNATGNPTGIANAVILTVTP